MTRAKSGEKQMLNQNWKQSVGVSEIYTRSEALPDEPIQMLKTSEVPEGEVAEAQFRRQPKDGPNRDDKSESEREKPVSP
jgi:hypothetical protein